MFRDIVFSVISYSSAKFWLIKQNERLEFQNLGSKPTKDWYSMESINDIENCLMLFHNSSNRSKETKKLCDQVDAVYSKRIKNIAQKHPIWISGAGAQICKLPGNSHILPNEVYFYSFGAAAHSYYKYQEGQGQ